MSATQPARRQCTAMAKQTRERCKLPPVPGGTLCRFHGGRTPVRMAAARRRLAQEEAAELVAARVEARGPLTLPEVYSELLATAGEVVAWRDLLAGKVAELGRLHGPDHNGDERVKADVQLFERAMDRAARVLELIARLDLDTRLAALDARTGDALARVIRRVLERAEMTEDARRDALVRIVPDELRREGAR